MAVQFLFLVPQAPLASLCLPMPFPVVTMGLPGMTVSLGVSRVSWPPLCSRGGSRLRTSSLSSQGLSILPTQALYVPRAPQAEALPYPWWLFSDFSTLATDTHYTPPSPRLLALCSGQIYALGKSRGQSRRASRGPVILWTGS